MPTRIDNLLLPASHHNGSGERFPRTRRLVKHEVVALLERGARFNRGEFALRVGQSTVKQGRLAISVPKRLLKRATDRNYIKRVIREGFRRHEVRALPVDLLVTLRSHTPAEPMVGAGANASKRSLRRERLMQLLSEVSRRFGVAG